MAGQADRCRVFRELHQSGCFVIPNPWDLGSARALVRMGFRALATTSAGLAWSLGRRDHGVLLDEKLAHLRSMSEGVDVPLNADFEGGFAVEPAAVAANVAAAAATGIAGLSIEDSTGNPSSPLFDLGPYYLTVLVQVFGSVSSVAALGSKARERRGPRPSSTW